MDAPGTPLPSDDELPLTAEHTAPQLPTFSPAAPPFRPSTSVAARTSSLRVPPIPDPSSRAARQLLLIPESDLTERYDLSGEEAKALLEDIAWHCSPLRGVVAPLEHTPDTRMVPTGLRALDEVLLGGLREGFLVELTGASGSGKSWEALHWARHAAMEHRRPVLWLHTCPSAGMDAWVTAALSQSDTNGGRRHRRAPWQLHFRTAPLTTMAEAMSALGTLLDGNQSLLRTGEEGWTSGLLVVDSLSQLVHRSYTGSEEDCMQRQLDLVDLMEQLKRVAVAQRVCVLLLTASVALTASSTEDRCGEFGSLLYHTVNVRLRLSHGLCWDKLARRCVWRRQLLVQKCPLSGPCSVVLVGQGPLYSQAFVATFDTSSILSEEAPAAMDVWDNVHVPSVLHL